MNLKDMISAFVELPRGGHHRRTKFLLNKARDRAHILVGLRSRSPISTRSSGSSAPPRRADRPRTLDGARLAGQGCKAAGRADRRSPPQGFGGGTYKLSDEQARAILDLRLQRLTALGRDEIEAELDGLGKEIAEYLDPARVRASSRSSRTSLPRSGKSSPRRAKRKSPARKSARSTTKT
jgi:DNA gyrase subunit A